MAAWQQNVEQFPVDGLLPKDETGALEFLKGSASEKWDGRGVIVAIFDTGVDPAAAGLQTTPDGRPKVVDIIDGTGSGDVDTSNVVEGEKEIKGLSGRTLRLGNWKNPSGKWHIGMISAYELFSKPLVDRVKKERQKTFDIQQREAKTKALRELDDFDRQNPDKNKLEGDKSTERKELEARVNQLDELSKSYSDRGPLMDVICFHDGDRWNAVVDTRSSGDLTSAKVMTDYHVERQYDRMSDVDMMSYCINIYEEGNIVSIVTDCSPHGTHVAGIVGAHHPQQPELNGVAPGVQIVSVKIGDHRQGSEEIGTSVVRGLIAAKRNGCDVINMSYGEAANRPNVGRTIEIIKEFVNRHDIIFVCSGGNNGPALSSVGCPGGSTAGVIGVGAYVSSQMMPTEYSLREKLPDIMYTWSSRGPTFDGDRGISICAPGGAFAAVPNWTLQKYQHMNGTSMSSPNACGAIALVLSALKDKGVKYRPHSVKVGVENTAKLIPGAEPWAVGCGCIRVREAFEYISKSPHNPDLRYEIKIKQKRGIYLRSLRETSRPHEFTVTVDAVWHEDTPNPDKVQYERRILLKSTENWVKCPQYLVSTSGSRNISVRVDPTALEEGRAYYTEVQGFDSDVPQAGPVFRIPITVIKPTAPPSDGEFKVEGNAEFTSGGLKRIFLQPPHGVSSADITIKREDSDTSRMFVIHTQQVKRHVPYRDTEVQQFFRLQPTESKTFHVPILQDIPLEVCLGQFWNSLGKSKMSYTISYHGVNLENSGGFILNGNDSILRIDAQSTTRMEDISPSVKVSQLQRPVRPSESNISPLDSIRDVLPDNRNILQLVLTYKFKLEDKVEDLFCFLPSHSPLLYESPFESQLWFIYDTNKKFIGSGDSYSERYKFSLQKGDYIVRLQLRHDSKETLEKHKNDILMIQHKISDTDLKGLDFKIYSNVQDAVAEGKTYSRKKLGKDKWTSIHVKAVGTQSSKLIKAGDTLLGHFTVLKDYKQPFRYIVPLAKISEKNETNPAEKILTGEEKYKKFLLDQTVTFLGTLLGKKDYETFYTVVDQVPNASDHLPLLQLVLQAHEEKKEKEKVLEKSGEILGKISEKEMAAHYGTKVDNSDPEQLRVRKEWDETKEIYINTLHRRSVAFAELGSTKEAEETKKELKKWVEEDNVKLLALEATQNKLQGHHALSLAAATKKLSSLSASDSTKKDLLDRQIECVKALGWNHWSDYLSQNKLTSYPVHYRPF
ncbi:hypothetical protein PROFUN_10526 [Planoprotostelium fungivorum]|uniref:Tripeptidyl-peptidase 2 n=1 Tax=Planoprotostelium fungivorum TaxID=1890364 RepID=A0A2P6NDB8_9EUKA|nr:hypothetical protein PROFUN_10526 [Planoprotostelium fungivorum]